MSAIIQLNCNSKTCDFEVRLAKNIPVWKADTPKELQRVPVMKINEQYVLGKASEHLCTSCNEVVRTSATIEVCPNCAITCFFLEEHDECPQCHIGKVEENKEMKTSF